MLLTSKELARLMNDSSKRNMSVLAIVPTPNLDQLENSGAASIDLRLGRWFRSFRQSRTTLLEMSGRGNEPTESRISKEYFVSFRDEFVLHPGSFVLGTTLEWIHLPNSLAGYITGKSSWGRRGLIIETAAGIHPGFTGCLTLEIGNLGSAPISLRPGMQISQIFLHEVRDSEETASGQFVGRRKPLLGKIRPDEVLNKLQGRT